jgi:hypothetical protein
VVALINYLLVFAALDFIIVQWNPLIYMSPGIDEEWCKLQEVQNTFTTYNFQKVKIYCKSKSFVKWYESVCTV